MDLDYLRGSISGGGNHANSVHDCLSRARNRPGIDADAHSNDDG
jgi:hypothetical protein